VELDVGSLIRRLVLFERYTLRSIHLLEIPSLVSTFGEGGLRALLADGCLRIQCQPLRVGETLTFDEPADFPEGAMQFRTLMPADSAAYLDECFAVLDSLEDLSPRQAKRLEPAIRDALVDVDDAARLASEKMSRDLSTRSPVLAAGMALALRREHGVQLNPADIQLDIELLPPVELFGEGVMVEHNLPDLGVTDPIETDHALVHGFLAVGNLNLRIALMEHLGGIGGCTANDLSLIDSKLRFLLAEADPGAQEDRLLRVQALAGVPEPDLSQTPVIDADALLAARGLPEARALRGWLRGVGSMSDDEVRDSFHVVGESLGRAVRSTPGKMLGIAVITAAGAASLAAGGPPTSPGLDLLDAFLLERLLPEPGPYSFLSHTWPSLFKRA
jgi:hypothetical protein